jgi:hypothetical protein
VQAGHRGVPTTLDYTAICTDGLSGEIDAYVKGHPRCYSSTCNDLGAEMMESLFDQFTMYLTEERHPGWQCDGNLGVGNKFLSAGSSCELETKLINDLDAIIKSSFGISDISIKKKKKWFVVPLKKEDVTFGTSATFAASCNDQNGWYEVIKDTKVMCNVEGATSEAKGLPFEIKSFPVCLGSSCTDFGLDPVFKDTTVASQFQAKMVKEEAIANDMICSITSAGAGLAIGISTSIVTLAVSLLILL